MLCVLSGEKLPAVIDIKEEEEERMVDNDITEVTPSSPSDNSATIDQTDLTDLNCPLCSEQFHDKPGMAKHLRDRHDIGNMYVCTVCHDVCWSNKAFIQHMKEHQNKSDTVGTRSTDRTGRRKHTPKKVEKGEIKLVLQENINKLLKHGETKQNDIKVAKNIKKESKAKLRSKSLTKLKSTFKERKAKPAISKSRKRKSKPVKEEKVQTNESKKEENDSEINGNEVDDEIGSDANGDDIKGEKTEQCNDCGKLYASKRALRRHNATMHQLKRYMCDTCGRCFTGRDSLNRHIRGLHKMEKVYKCTVPGCTAAYNFNHSLKLHLLKHSGERPYSCNVCFKTYLTAHHLKIHYQAVHSDSKNFVCRFCGKKFSYSTSHKMHEMTHTKDRPYPCGQCEKSFVNGQALKYHVMAKHSVGNFKCDICQREYKTEFLLRSHKRRHTADSTRFMCDICGGQFMYKSALELHKSVHKDSKDFTCKICGKSFKTYPTLYSHQYVHKDDSPFKCSTCGKAFKTKERCKAHERRHSGLKPFECGICHRHFPDNGGLQKHLRTVHCTVKKFACEICGKTTSRADNLRVHMKVHTKPGNDDKIGKSIKRGVLPSMFDTDEKKSLKETTKKKKKVLAGYAESYSPSETQDALTSTNADLFLQSTVINAYTPSNSETVVSPNSRQGSSCMSGMNSDSSDLQNRIPHIVQQDPAAVSNPEPTASESPLMLPVQIIQTQDAHTTPVAAHNFTVPTLQPATHYMYPWPYMYQAGIQPSQGGSNTFFQ